MRHRELVISKIDKIKETDSVSKSKESIWVFYYFSFGVRDGGETHFLAIVVKCRFVLISSHEYELHTFFLAFVLLLDVEISVRQLRCEPVGG